MLRTNTRARPGGLSRGPRILFLGTAALALAVLVGLWAYGQAVNKDVGATAGGTAAIGIFTAGPGLILAWLAAPGEANSRRTTTMWVALLSYIGTIAGASLLLIGDAMWMAGGGDTIILNNPPQPGLVGSAAAGVAVAGDLLFLPALLVLVPAGLYTLWAYWRAPHRAPDERREYARGVASGFAMGAVVLVALLAALGLAHGFLWHYPITPAMAAWPDEGRVVFFSVAVGMAVALVAVGAALHLLSDGGKVWGRVLLWIGAVALILAGLLDSFSATSLSGTTGTYVRSAANGPDVVPNDVLLNGWVGLGTFLLPAGVVALLLAISVLHLHLPRQLHLPRYHHHMPTIGAT